MKKLLLSAAAFGLLSGAALAEPQKLDDSILGDVAAGQPTLTGSGFQVSTSEMNSMFTTTTETNNTVREANQTISVMSGNTVYATGLASTGVSATGTSAASVMAPISFP